MRYEDTDRNGYIDQIEYDLDGDKSYEDKVSLRDLGIDDRRPLYRTGDKAYGDHRVLFHRVAEDIWKRAQLAIRVAEQEGIDTNWYNFYKRPMSIHQRYEFGYWLGFYIYQDLRHQARLANDADKIKRINRAYYTGDWSSLLSPLKK